MEQDHDDEEHETITETLPNGVLHVTYADPPDHTYMKNLILNVIVTMNLLK